MKITKTKFGLFKRECKKWIDIYGLHNWDIRYFLKNGEPRAYAYTNLDFSNRCADITLTENWKELSVSPSEDEIKKTAFHEVTEVFFYTIRYLAECRFLTDSEVDPEIHNLIRTLENILYPKY